MEYISYQKILKDMGVSEKRSIEIRAELNEYAKHGKKISEVVKYIKNNEKITKSEALFFMYYELPEMCSARIATEQDRRYC